MSGSVADWMPSNGNVPPEATSAAAPMPRGLTSAEATRRLREYGPNAVEDAAPPRWRLFFAKFWAPVPWMLEIALVLQLALGEHVEAATVGALLLFNATLSVIQEGRATAALAALKNQLAPTALVCRDGEWGRRPAAELVPGDAIRLPLGSLVPADATIVSGALMVDQSMLTGESVPVEAIAGNQVYASSLVRRGQAIALVTATGAKTNFGRAAELVRVARVDSTEQAAIFAATRNLAIVNGTIGALLLIYAYGSGLPVVDLVRLGLTALLATIPVALPATFTLSAAFGAQILARRGVLLTRLSAAHEAAAMDILCVDKTGTLTRNALEVVDVAAMPGFDRERVLEFAALASSDADQDPIDGAIRAVAPKTSASVIRFVPFDPASRISEAFALDRDEGEIRIVKGAFEVIAERTEISAAAVQAVNNFANEGHRVIAVAVGPLTAPRLVGLIAISDPPREDSAELIAALRDLHVRTVMATGDSPVTAAEIASEVGIEGAVCASEGLSAQPDTDRIGVYARMVPEEKYRLVRALQSRGHVVGMCGDGANDAPALRQAQIGIAVSSATDVAKAAAGMVMTKSGLAGIVFAVREGRIGFHRLLSYTFNMLVKKIEIVLFLAIGLALTGHAVMTPVLMVLMLLTNDFLSMSLTTDRASVAPSPSVWRMGDTTRAAMVLGVCKLGFSTTLLAIGKFKLGLGAQELQTLAFVTLVFGNQALMYVLRERRHMWRSKPGAWVLASSALDIGAVLALAWSGTLMAPMPAGIAVAVFVAAIGFALVLDQIKLPVMRTFKIG